MAKPHKFLWTGIDVVTALDSERIWLTVAEALVAGKGKIKPVAETPLVRAYDIKGSETIFATKPELSFDVQLSDETEGRRAIRTRIITALLKDGSIPFGPKHMLGHKAYMRFVQELGIRIGNADPSASVQLREGPMPDGFDLAALRTRVAAPRPA